MARRKKVVDSENIENRESNEAVKIEESDIDKVYQEDLAALRAAGLAGPAEGGGSEDGGYPGKTSGTGRKEKGEKVSVDEIGDMIFAIHDELAERLKMPELAIKEKDAHNLGKAINRVDKGAIKKKFPPKTWNFLFLIAMILLIYVPIGFDLYDRWKAKKQSKVTLTNPRMVNAVAKSNASNTVIEPKDYMDLSG